MRHGIDAKITVVSKGDDISGLASQLFRAGYGTLVAAGGDGTVSAVASAIVDTEAAMGIPPGPEMGKLLAEIRERQLADELTSAEQAREWVKGRSTS